MTVVFVVDDSAVDRQLIGGIVKQETDWQIEYAVDGNDAISKMPFVKPDIVLTDLRMPEMDGLELVARIRQEYPSTPVILITSQGSEELAIKALQAGAASYTPKRTIAKSLVHTMKNVLSVSGQNIQRQRLSSRLTEGRLNWILENDSALIAPLVDQLQGLVGSWDESDRLRLGVAVDEALVNAMYHGNLEVSSDLRQEDDSEYYDLIKERQALAPFMNRKVKIQVDFSLSNINICIEDEGPGFDPSKLPDPTDPENIERASGRGLLLIRTFMDSVEHNPTGNQITMRKSRQAE